MPNARVRNRYMDDAAQTASPIALLSMLYDRLLKDLAVAIQGIENRDLATANNALCHAQDIVLELRSALNPEVWEGGQALAGIYAYLLDQLIQANVKKSVRKIEDCQKIVAPLAEAWSKAALEVGNQPAPAEVATVGEA